MAITRRQFLAATPVVAAGAGAITGLAQSGTWLKGIDVSYWQQTINWMSVRNSGVTFAFIRATRGLDYFDEYFNTNWTASRAAGILRGAYHYAFPGQDPIGQADFFIQKIRPTQGDLPPVLDLENSDGRTRPQVWAWTQAFVNRVRVKIGRAPIIYTGFYFWRDSVGNPTNNLGCPLWLAAYTSSTAGLIPPAWSTWTFWQYTSTGTIPGVTGNCDRDFFNGTLTQLRGLQLT